MNLSLLSVLIVRKLIQFYILIQHKISVQFMCSIITQSLIYIEKNKSEDFHPHLC